MKDNTLVIESQDFYYIKFLLEVAITRQQNYIIENERELSKIGEKVSILQEKLKSNKFGFVDRESKIGNLNLLKNQIDRKLTEAKIDLHSSRRIYKRILSIIANNNGEDVNNSLTHEYKLEESRDKIIVFSNFKDYFEIEHYIYR
jgi:hypothetical protein